MRNVLPKEVSHFSISNCLCIQLIFCIIVFTSICVAELFVQEGVKKSNNDYDVVKASVKYVRAYEHAKKDGKTDIFYDGTADALNAERACQILNHEWLSGDVS